MDKAEIVFISGIIGAVIWLGFCFFIEGKKRNIVIAIGILIDIVMYVISPNEYLLLAGVLGGFACGLIPCLVSVRKYNSAVREMKGKWVIVSVILFVMFFFFFSVAFPELTAKWKL